MDHLPYPQDAEVPPVSIPVFHGHEFDGGDFTNFPTRCGFDKAEFMWSDFSSVPSIDHTSFFQAWLYFGLMYEILGAPRDQFIDSRTGNICTTRLPHWTQKWRKGLASFSRSKRRAEYERVQACLKEACDVLTFLDDSKRRLDGRSNLNEEVAFSIAVLSITLDQVMNKHDLVTSMGGNEEQLFQLSMVNGWPTTVYATNRLEAAGWCRSETRRLATDVLYISTIYIMAPRLTSAP